MRSLLHVLPDAVHPPPHRISAVEPWIRTVVEQIRYQTMTQARTEPKDDVARLVESTSQQQQTAQSDERITTPAPHVARTKVRQTGRQRGTAAGRQWQSSFGTEHRQSGRVADRNELERC